MSDKTDSELMLYADLLAHAKLNDDLLQAYRSHHLTLQSIFLAIATGLSLAVLAFNEFVKSALTTFILVIFSIISIFLLIKMRGIIIARGRDVSFWHRELIKAERNLPPNKRYFTQFKIFQKTQRANANYLQKLFLSDKELNDKKIDLIVERGLGHTRKVLDKWLFLGIGIIWVLLLSISAGYTLYLYLSSLP